MEQKVIEVANIFQRISEVSSKNEKIAIIKSNKDNSLFLNFLVFAFDDFVRTGISSKKINSGHLPKANQHFDDIVNLFSYVKENNTGKMQVVANIKDYIAEYDTDVQDFLKSVFSKNLKVGITAKSVNKAIDKGFIKEFSCQLAFPYNKYPNKVIGETFTLTQKLDGNRCIVIVKNGEAKFFTRKGLEYTGLDLLKNSAESMAKSFGRFYSDGIVFDGELVLANPDNLSTDDLFRLTTKTLKNSALNKDNMIFNMFDWLPLEEFEIGESKLEYLKRRAIMNDCYENKVFKNINLVEDLYTGEDLNKIAELQKEYVDKLGWEGLMLNLANGKYVTKRTPNLLKIKKFCNADVLVKDIYEGTGINEGRLGGVIIDYKGHDVQVGSGFTEDDRINFWKNPKDIVGKIIDVKYFEESHNQKDDGISLRFPIYQSVRFDKTIDDISYES